MITNTNPETGIRYGVVSLNSLEAWVFDEFYNGGTNVSFENYMKEAKTEFVNDNGRAEDWEDFGEDTASEQYESDEDTYELETLDGLKLGMSTLGGAYLVWVFESPHTAEHGLCSPCCPNAGDLDSVGDFTCYTLPPDWFSVDDIS